MKGIVLVRDDGWTHTVIPHGLTVTFTTEGRKAVAEGDGFKFAFGAEVGTDKARALALKVATAYANGETGVFGGPEVEKPEAEPVGPVEGMRIKTNEPDTQDHGVLGTIRYPTGWYDVSDFCTFIIPA